MMSGAWMVVRGTGQPVGECMPPLLKLSTAVRMDRCGEIIHCDSRSTATPLTVHQASNRMIRDNMKFAIYSGDGK